MAWPPHSDSSEPHEGQWATGVPSKGCSAILCPSSAERAVLALYRSPFITQGVFCSLRWCSSARRPRDSFSEGGRYPMPSQMCWGPHFGFSKLFYTDIKKREGSSARELEKLPGNTQTPSLSEYGNRDPQGCPGQSKNQDQSPDVGDSSSDSLTVLPVPDFALCTMLCPQACRRNPVSLLIRSHDFYPL